jgi:hypothetical protein
MKNTPRMFCLLRLLVVVSAILGLASFAQAKTYYDNGDGTVTDPTTGLTWMRCAVGQTWDGSTCSGAASVYIWDQANALTGTVSFAGQSDWRLPNIRELETIVDRSRVDPAIDIAVFPNTPSSPSSDFWSSTPNLGGLSSSAFYVRFYFGNAYFSGKLTGGYARLVRGGQTLGMLNPARPTSDYVDNNDGTVTHGPTGLMWKRCAEGQTWNGITCTGTAGTYTWDAAKLLTSTFVGKSDWRLPTQEELLSMVDYGMVIDFNVTTSTAKNATIFPNAPSDPFWSATSSVGSAYWAWYVFFGYRTDGYDGYKTSAYYAYLVRNTLPSSPTIGAASPGSGSASIAFTAPSSNGGLTITGYTATCGSKTGTGTSSPITVTGLTNGMTYSCSVTATNTVGTSTASSAVSVTPVAQTSAVTLTFASGWNLVGNSVNAPLTVATTFGDTTKVFSVWKWGGTTSKWAFYTPTQSDGGAAYAATKGYEVLTTINGGEAFWVNAQTAFAVPLPSGSAIASTSFQSMASGWKLISIGSARTPSAFNIDMSMSPPAAGVVPKNITSLWAWDNAQSKWYFYSPTLEAQGGTALTDYISSHGYLDFTAANKALGPGVGFWVNKP